MKTVEEILRSCIDEITGDPGPTATEAEFIMHQLDDSGYVIVPKAALQAIADDVNTYRRDIDAAVIDHWSQHQAMIEVAQKQKGQPPG